jgi:sec-independent protein translocase protein TatA
VRNRPVVGVFVGPEGHELLSDEVVGDILQPTHLLFVFIVALVVLGPKRLPEVARSLGEGLRDFRTAISGEHSADANDEHDGYVPDDEHTGDDASAETPHEAVLVAETPHDEAVLVTETPHDEAVLVTETPHDETPPSTETPDGNEPVLAAPVPQPVEAPRAAEPEQPG